jgi:DNA polymerase/3'-5' exonuclease PolX
MARMQSKLKSGRKTRKSTYKSNDKIIFILEAVKKYYARMKDTIHVNAYERAIHQIKKWPNKITQGKDIAHLEGIGKGMIEKIDTILKTGTLPILADQNINISTNYEDNTNADSTNANRIENILGFGTKLAAELKNKHNITTIKQLEELVKENGITLTPAQYLGLRYHNDLQKKIPRKEITQIGNVINNILEDEEKYKGKEIYSLLAGSYPSGLKTESKDIDILFVARDSHITLPYLISKLKSNSALMLETISLGTTKFLGLIKMQGGSGIWHHLDIRLVDIAAFPYAWLYYTGGKIFNKMIREKLKKKQYKLNEWGLYKMDKKVILVGEMDNNELMKLQMTEKELLDYAVKIEKQIFNLAGMEYKTIRERY